MYRNHQPVISEYARQNPDNFADVIKFVLCTIRQPLDVAVDQASGVNTEDKLFGFKLHAWLEVKAHKKDLYQKCEYYWSIRDKVSLLDTLTNCYGLGLVKAGFVCQLVYGFGGCIDTHNLELFKIPQAAVRLSKKLKPETRVRKAREYLRLTADLGGSEYLWNNWCEHVAQANPTRYTNANEVSYLHIIGVNAQ